MVVFLPLSVNIEPRTLRLLSKGTCVHLGLPLLSLQALLLGMMLEYTLFRDWVFYCESPNDKSGGGRYTTARVDIVQI